VFCRRFLRSAGFPLLHGIPNHTTIVLSEIEKSWNFWQGEEPSASLNRTPLAVAVCSDPGKSGAYIQDVYIAACHFMAACRCYGVGTCWVAAMDRADVKKVPKIPDRHYVVTVTPVGHPTRIPESPPKESSERDGTILIGCSAVLAELTLSFSQKTLVLHEYHK
jgi:nitroreductase